MRAILSAMAMLLCAAAGLQSGDDPLASLRFSDGRDRSLADFPHQSVLVVYFCGHCPTAAAFLGKQVREVYDFIEQEKVPLHVVLATPDLPPADVLALNKERHYQMDFALWASDPANAQNISLQNVYQTYMFGPDRKATYFRPGDVRSYMASPSAGSLRYPVDGLSDPRVKDLWWMVERQRPDALPSLVSLAKAKSPAQGELQKVLAVVKDALALREADLVAAPVSMATYEQIEALLAEAKGIELKQASARWRELGKAKELKDELEARSMYRTCQQALQSPKPDMQKAGHAGLEQLAKRYPETLYGRRAAAN